MLGSTLSDGDLEPAMQGLSSEEPVTVLPCLCSGGFHRGLRTQVMPGWLGPCARTGAAVIDKSPGQHLSMRACGERCQCRY